MKLVMKFGGTSVADGQRIRHVAKLVADHSKGNRIAVVVSAMGSTTDELAEASGRAERGDQGYVEEFARRIREGHLAAAEEAIRGQGVREEVSGSIATLVGELEGVLTGVALIRELTGRSRDYILSFGERLSSLIVGGALRDVGLESRPFTGASAGIVTDSNFGEARPLMNATMHQVRERLGPLLERGIVPVVAGFIAADQDGVTTTLGRGGSDYTASIIGASIEADEVWIWTDVDGLMSSDPRIVSSAKVLPEISFAEAFEMSIFGAKAMHPRALEPAMLWNIPVRIRSAFKPGSPGTLIVRGQRVLQGRVVKAAALVRDVGMITVSGGSMVGAPGTAARVFDTLGRNKINVMMISQSVSESNISMVVSRRSLSGAVSALEVALLGRDIVREVASKEDICVVAVIGAGIRDSLGVAARVFGAVARAGVNVEMIAQGYSGDSVSFVVKDSDGAKAVKALHEEFGLDRD